MSFIVAGQGYEELADSSLTPITLPPSSLSLDQANPFNLVLSPNSLSPGLTHTFQLTITNEAGAASARVTLSPDPPPHSAVLTITPTGGGTSLDTVFTLSVSGALDVVSDSPFLYQFGLISDHNDIVWLTGAQVEPDLQTLLPAGPLPWYNHSVLVRVFDRSGGFSDSDVAVVTVDPASTVSDEYIRDILVAMETEFRASRDWQHLLSNLVSVVMEIDSTPSLSSSLKQEALELFLEVFHDDIPATPTHYQLAAQLMYQFVTDITPDNSDIITVTLTTIGSWFREQSAINTESVSPVVNGNHPLQLLPVEGVASPITHLPPLTASHLMTSWSSVVPHGTTPTDDVAISLAEAIDTIGYALCQGMVYGEAPSLVTSSTVNMSVYKTRPTGEFIVDKSLVDFGTALEDVFHEQACPYEQQTCFETCVLMSQYSFDLFSGDFLQLSATTEDRISTEIEGSDPLAIELASTIASVTVPIPSQNGFLSVEDLEQEIEIFLPRQDTELTNGSIPLCLYREFGGKSGFTSPQWQLDSTSPPTPAIIDSVAYYRCRYSHLTEFAVGLLPPPILPPPPSPTPTPSPSTSSNQPPPPSSMASPITPTSERQTGISPVVFAVPVVLVIIVAAVVVCVVAIFLVWKKKKRTLKISPDEGPSGVEGTDRKVGTKLVRSGPLTPEESKVPMPIIELQEGGKRAVVGSMNVLPSIRLRELRYYIHDQFASFKSKPFYFLTRQLVDIEPPTEQQQFVSLVYGEEPDKPIFIRRVETTSDLTRLHFCVCGNAAQFECSSCGARGYCSPECQTSDWADRHQRECARLGEKKQRMSVLLRQSSSLSPVEEHKRLPSIFPEKQNMSAATPLDFRSLLSSQRSFQRPSFSSSQSLEPSVATPSMTTPTKPTLPPLSITPRSTRTTLGMLASQPRPPTIKEEENEGEGEEGEVTTIPSPSTSVYRPAVQRYGRRRLTPLPTTPARLFPTSPSLSTPLSHPLLPSSSPPHSTPITSSHFPPNSQFFHRPDPNMRHRQERYVTMDTRKLSVQSLGGPTDYGTTSPPLPDIREEAQLAGGSGGGNSKEGSRPRSTTHSPPALSKKFSTTPSSPSSSSLSSSGSGEDDSSSSTQPSTPLVTEHN